LYIPFFGTYALASRRDSLLSIAMRTPAGAPIRTRAVAFWTKLVNELSGAYENARAGVGFFIPSDLNLHGNCNSLLIWYRI
jgi:hypothetical protein